MCFGSHTFPDGRKFAGEWKDGKRHGQGTTVTADGSKYVGEWKDGQTNGQGNITFPDGSKFVGEFKNGQANGQGTRTSSNGTVLHVGRWADGIFLAEVSNPAVAPKIEPKSLMQRANQGNSEAQYQYGMTFINGTGDEIQPRIALKWFSEAAKQGHGPAQRQIESMFDLGARMSAMESPIQLK